MLFLTFKGNINWLLELLAFEAKDHVDKDLWRSIVEGACELKSVSNASKPTFNFDEFKLREQTVGTNKSGNLGTLLCMPALIEHVPMSSIKTFFSGLVCRGMLLFKVEMSGWLGRTQNESDLETNE